VRGVTLRARFLTSGGWSENLAAMPIIRWIYSESAKMTGLGGATVWAGLIEPSSPGDPAER